ncbi:PorT family protein [Aquimarina sp. MMG015]|uniref:type IX secretion/gliding motility protein PorT/SprT n=1 Tax=Aquimarina TaxID=290174 RepID=UPI0003FA8AE2|nr:MULTISPECIES: porin family protein [Aquimarina]AXT58255.1 PorT family protein [Aquimarina sp. AD1]MBQ4804917.1 PorT family protein [Aquimarina sp. MMG015]RKN36091.1 PorT family protein [Aquimarina sp. AD1]
MKRVFIAIAVIVCTQNVSAQLFSKERVRNLQNYDKPRLSWGYILGFNSYDFNFDYKATPEGEEPLLDGDIQVAKSIGFNVGLLGNMRINDYLDLRLEPQVSFVRRDLTFTGPDFEDSQRFREVTSTYVHIPLLLKISTKRLNNFKPFIVGGVSTSINLSSNEDNPDDNSVGQFRTKTNTNYFELGFGIDFYMFYFKFTPSIRGVFAMSDELVADNDPNSPYTAAIDKMSSRGLFINFTFQ